MTYSDDPAAYQRAYYSANRERIRARQRARGKTEADRARDRQWRLVNREKERTRQREQRAANRDVINARKRERYAADPEKARAEALSWPSSNRVTRRAVALKYLHGLSPEGWAALWESQDGRCYLCDRDLDARGGRLVHMDHDHAHCAGDRSCRICQRGLACAACNKLIAMADDDPDRLRLIADNLEVALAAVRARMASAPEQLELG